MFFRTRGWIIASTAVLAAAQPVSAFAEPLVPTIARVTHAPVSAPPTGVALAVPEAAESASELTQVAPQPRGQGRHAIYVDLFGKGGLWGVGYDYQLTPRLGVGAVGSYYVLGGDRFLTASPYLSLTPVLHGAHRWFVHAGPQLVRRATPSPVPEWAGLTSTSYAAEVSSGYEYRNGLLFRAYAMGSIGEHVVPGIGISLGWSR